MVLFGTKYQFCAEVQKLSGYQIPDKISECQYGD